MIEDFRLRVFDKVAQTGSFTLAARDLGVSQPAVSQNVASLEQAVGEPLLVRSRGFVSLTPKGEALLAYVRKILYWYDRLDAELVRGAVVPPEPVAFRLSDSSEASITVEDGELRIVLKQQ